MLFIDPQSTIRSLWLKRNCQISKFQHEARLTQNQNLKKKKNEKKKNQTKRNVNNNVNNLNSLFSHSAIHSFHSFSQPFIATDHHHNIYSNIPIDIMLQLDDLSYSRIKTQAKNNIYITLTIAIISLYLLKTIIIDEDSSYLFDLSDGPGTKGYGITKGGTGNSGYQKDHRTGGLPPSARKIYHDKDNLQYEDYEIDFYQETETFSKDKNKNKIIIILGANIEGGVNKWKGPNEWSIERSSILNKKHYAKKHGYDLVIKDYTKSKKYSKEFREGWQKFDMIKEVMDEYKPGDWFWYIDLYSLIMEPQISLENLIFDKINETITRDLNYFNPNELELDIPYINYNEPINLILTQDCGGFNLQSFLIKKTQWSLTLLDVLFDPVFYLQNIDYWKNGEKNALEYYFNEFGWIRSKIGFLPTKTISALPKGACPDFEGDERFFYNESSRDFLVNMMGCEYNRNCWDEMEFFKQLSKKLHQKWYQGWF